MTMVGRAFAIACALSFAAAHADEIKVIAGSAIQPVTSTLVTGFEQQTGHRVAFDWGAVGEMARRAGAGEKADIVVVSLPQMDALEREGRVHKDSRIVIGKTGVGVFVRKGVPHPDISTVEAFRKTMLEARSVGFNDPAAGAPVSIYLLDLFRRLGIAEEMAKKSVAFKQRSERFGAVARGDVQIGFNQVSEIVAVPEVELVGPLPSPIQNHTVLSAAVLTTADHEAAARDLLRYLSREDSIATFRRGGFDAP
jgi:molybdate transport system substrate-binding protein